VQKQSGKLRMYFQLDRIFGRAVQERISNH